MVRAIMMSVGITMPFILFTLGKEGKGMTELVVTAKTSQPLRMAFLSVEVPTVPDVKSVRVIAEDGRNCPAQLFRDADGKFSAVWLETQIPANSQRSYKVILNPEPVQPKVLLTQEQKWVSVTINGQLFTRYYFTTEFAKPFCFPLVGPNGKILTRGFPVEPREGETRDHPHHKGFWVAHGDVNGHDLWSEKGKIVHKNFEVLESGPLFGLIKARHDWLGTDGKKLCETLQELRFSSLNNMRILDLTQTFIATEGDVNFGDTKEGFVAIRIPDELTLSRGTGRILLSTGQRDRDAWGKRAKWCLYYGTVAGEPVAIAFFDHKDNRSFPTPWHVRDYGLFANGPFGRKDFGLPPEDVGKLERGEKLTLKYRIILFSYHPTPEELDELWEGFASPPSVQ
ncbi:MAG: PmoA family protein [Armatimonadetes bacterium]|nr:PmoA family protein [Armatimonadota bacterium]MCX7969414.1 PmoA family protein [Armatimonadota bacterium]MDW8141961.1 PmoA family protein [Armatimonadota bacterium]